MSLNSIPIYLELFRERLSEKVHAAIPKGIAGGFEGTVLQRNLKEWYGRSRTYFCGYSRKATKVGSTSFGIVACAFLPTTFLETAVNCKSTDDLSKSRLGVYTSSSNSSFPSSPGPLFQNEVKCSAFDMKRIFHSHANKTHVHKKGCALGLILAHIEREDY